MGTNDATYILKAIEQLRNEMLARHDAHDTRLESIQTRLDQINGKVQRHEVTLGRIMLAGTTLWALFLAAVGAFAKKVFG